MQDCDGFVLCILFHGSACFVLKVVDALVRNLDFLFDHRNSLCECVVLPHLYREIL